MLTSAGGAAPWSIRATLGRRRASSRCRSSARRRSWPSTTAACVYRSADAGATWTAALAAPPDLDAPPTCTSTTLLDGWVVGQGFDGAALFHTVDGGTTWTPVPDFQGTYVAVDFAGASGWAAAVDGTLYRTIDDGATLDARSSFPDCAPTDQDLDFWDASIGYAVGGVGYAARSDDGGLTWQILPTPDADGSAHRHRAHRPGRAVGEHRRRRGALLGDRRPELGRHGRRRRPASAPTRRIVASPAGDAWIAGWQGAIRHFAGPPPPPVNQPPAASFTFLTTGLVGRASPTPAATPTAPSSAGCGTSATAPPRPSSTRRTSSRRPAPTSSP